jgi:hypothetical protein
MHREPGILNCAYAKTVKLNPVKPTQERCVEKPLAAPWGGKVIALFAWAPQPNSGVYIVKLVMRLINSENLHIKNPDAV